MENLPNFSELFGEIELWETINGEGWHQWRDEEEEPES